MYFYHCILTEKFLMTDICEKKLVQAHEKRSHFTYICGSVW